MNILFLHHSTGEIIWNGSSPGFFQRAAGKISNRLARMIGNKPKLEKLLHAYNKDNHKNYTIREMAFPKEKPYGWHNFPYDYYNIWVKNAGDKPYMEEPTLEMLTRQYQVILFKHCFPVSNIRADLDSADINSDMKTLSNYKLQYQALKEKLHQFPGTKFIVFTGAAQVKTNVSEDKALRAKEFFEWVKTEWDQPDDNIYIWDLYSLQTEGGLYFKNEYAAGESNSHPNSDFAARVSGLLFNRIIDVIDHNGSTTTIDGQLKENLSQKL